MAGVLTRLDTWLPPAPNYTIVYGARKRSFAEVAECKVDAGGPAA
jgi:hypothetical protein